MGKVLIIKNNMNEKIHEYAMESYENNDKRYYNSVDGTFNEEGIEKLKEDFNEEGIVLLITYEDYGEKIIKDAFIGNVVKINEKNKRE